MSLGFNKLDAAQAYFACDKNEELAANLLFDRMANGDLEPLPEEGGPGNGGSGGNGGNGGNQDDDDDDNLFNWYEWSFDYPKMLNNFPLSISLTASASNILSIPEDFDPIVVRIVVRFFFLYLYIGIFFYHFGKGGEHLPNWVIVFGATLHIRHPIFLR